MRRRGGTLGERRDPDRGNKLSYDLLSTSREVLAGRKGPSIVFRHVRETLGKPWGKLQGNPRETLMISLGKPQKGYHRES